MAKLKHAADGSLHLLQPAMQLMVPLMTKALRVFGGGRSAACGCMRQQGLNGLLWWVFFLHS